jgi:hypothetical protein
VRFRRRSDQDLDDLLGADDRVDGPDAGDPRAGGPLDSEELSKDNVERVDLGSLLIAPEENRELRLQVDEASGQVQAVMLAGPDGAVELRAFGASRNEDLWAEVRPKIAADVAQQGGTATEREGPFGTELVIVAGRGAERQTSRVVGINGPRWLLRATLYGRPADSPDDAAEWVATVRRVVVHRGAHAVPPGEALPVTMPPQARRVDG